MFLICFEQVFACLRHLGIIWQRAPSPLIVLHDLPQQLTRATGAARCTGREGTYAGDLARAACAPPSAKTGPFLCVA
eukprot:4539124-Pyramimonas_sp.AAC.1